MKISIQFHTRDKSGRQRTTEITGMVKTKGQEIPALDVLRQLWEAERAINEHTTIRCHITELIEGEEEPTDG